MPSATTPDAAPALIDVEAVAAMLSVSRRHIYSLANAGRMPRPRKIGRLVRWSRSEIHSWVADGCPEVDSPKRHAATAGR